MAGAPCYNIVVDLRSAPFKVEVEIDGMDSEVALCDATIREVKGAATRSEEGRCFILEPREEVITLKYVLEGRGDDLCLLTPPSEALLPVAVDDPYRATELSMTVIAPADAVVDGLAGARCRVITCTKYFHAEGRLVPQVVAYRGIVPQNEFEIPRCALYTYPVRCGDPAIDSAKFEEHLRGYGLVTWATALRKAARAAGYWWSVRALASSSFSLAKRFDRLRARFVLARLLAATALFAGYSPHEFAGALLDRGILSSFELVTVRKTSEGLEVNAKIPMRLKVRGVHDGYAIVVEFLVPESSKLSIPGCAWHSIAYLCDECWQPIA